MNAGGGRPDGELRDGRRPDGERRDGEPRDDADDSPRAAAWCEPVRASILAGMAILTLADGRSLEVLVSGREDGVPLVVHHGTPGGAARFGAFERAVHGRGLRLVTYSRPGYGASSRLRGRRVADAAADLAAVLDHLGAERCVTLGWSGGGPHVLARAALLPERVAAACCVAGVGPYGREDLDFLAGMGEDNVHEFGAAVQGEEVLAQELGPAAGQLRDSSPADLISAMSSLLPPVDAAALAGEPGEDLAAHFAYGLRDGADGWIDDDLAFTRDWGFDLGEIAVPVFLWQGGADLMVPFAHGGWLAEHVPGAVVHLEPDDGHVSVVFNHLDELFDELTSVL